jgi:hypothetical protein
MCRIWRRPQDNGYGFATGAGDGFGGNGSGGGTGGRGAGVGGDGLSGMEPSLEHRCYWNGLP